MGTDAKRTPGPYRYTRARDASKDFAIWAKNESGKDVFDSSLLLAEAYHVVGDTARVDAEANAAFIVRACNAHDALVEALKLALRARSYVAHTDIYDAAWGKIEAAIALATGANDD